MRDDLFHDIAAYLAARRWVGQSQYDWGACPVCLIPGEASFCDERGGAWGVCRPCAVRWLFGFGPVSGWEGLTPGDLVHHLAVLDGLRVVEPCQPRCAASDTTT